MLAVTEGRDALALLSGKSTTVQHKITQKRWCEFWKTFKTLNAWDWPDVVERPGGGFGADGDSWEMTAGHKRRLIQTCGHNAYPMGKDDKRAKRYASACWIDHKGEKHSCTHEFVRLLDAITGLYAKTKK